MKFKKMSINFDSHFNYTLLNIKVSKSFNFNFKYTISMIYLHKGLSAFTCI